MDKCFYPTSGLRQGSVIRPLIFNLYIDDLSQNLNKSFIGCNVSGTLINHVNYADDQVLVAPSMKGLQKLIDLCQKYNEDNDIMFNVQKTKCMHFNVKRYKNHEVNVTLYGESIEWVTEFSYLGCIVTNTMSDDIEMKCQYRYICAKSNTITRKFFSCNENIKIKLFNVFCTSIYGGALWCTYLARTYNRIRVCYNNAFRFILGLPIWCSASEMFATRFVLSFKELLRKKQYILMTAVQQSNNSLVKKCTNYLYTNTKLWSTWRNSLYSAN